MSDVAAVAASMPFLSAIGLAPAVTARRPSWTMAWASTVAVVVPSPAMSLVLVATSLASWAPRFSLGSSSSTSRATVTPSLVMVGAPHFLSITTLRPRGPSVTFTVSARRFTPRSSERRASSSNSSILAAMTSPDYVEHNGRAAGRRALVPPPQTPRRRPGRCGTASSRHGHARGEGSPADYFWTMASTSRAESTRYSSPWYFTSVPPYLL